MLLMRSGILQKGLIVYWQRNTYYRLRSKSFINPSFDNYCNCTVVFTDFSFFFCHTLISTLSTNTCTYIVCIIIVRILSVNCRGLMSIHCIRMLCFQILRKKSSHVQSRYTHKHTHTHISVPIQTQAYPYKHKYMHMQAHT